MQDDFPPGEIQHMWGQIAPIIGKLKKLEKNLKNS